MKSGEKPENREKTTEIFPRKAGNESPITPSLLCAKGLSGVFDFAQTQRQQNNSRTCVELVSFEALIILWVQE